ncbi:hypothetical protein J6590_091111 [Homalodisca vitripennis]|nr:hypothetical protein J6590_091111 [Homalodisca vitripennis]
MRSILSPLAKPRPATTLSPSTPTASAATSVPSTPPAPVSPPAPVCSTPDPGHTLTATTPDPREPVSIASELMTPENPVAEVSRLKKEVERLESEFKKLLDHTIESDSRLLQFTDQIFPVNTARVSAVDRGIQCESLLNPPEDPAPDSVDFSAQCSLWTATCTRCSESTDIINSLRTTTEVLQAENRYLKQQLCKAQTKKKKVPPYKKKNFQVLPVKEIKSPFRKQKLKTTSKIPIPPPHRENPNTSNNSQAFRTPIPHFRYINIRGDSHSRHIAGLVRNMTAPPFSVGGVCMPGAGLLDILSSDHTPSRPGIHCEVLLAGSNDLAVGRQRNIYRHLEAHITDRPANMELVLVTLPLRHDLGPDHPIHDETVLVNAYIEELAARHNIRVVDFNKIGRRHFTKHGQHLSMRGKRILAGMIVSSLALLRPAPSRLRESVSPPRILAATAPPALLTTVPKLAPAAADGGRLLPLSTLRGSPTPGSADKNGRSPESKNMDNLVGGKPD